MFTRNGYAYQALPVRGYIQGTHIFTILISLCDWSKLLTPMIFADPTFQSIEYIRQIIPIEINYYFIGIDRTEHAIAKVR